jgi:hypothetical protein
MFTGFDWASEEHAVCVHDAAGHKLASFAIAHSADGFEDLVRRLARLGDPAELPVAIERPDGRLVDRLLEARPSRRSRLAQRHQGLVAIARSPSSRR